MLERILADNCETYNAALQERIEAWKLQRKKIGLYDQFQELTELRKEEPYQWIACDIQRDPLRRVDLAFKAFFRRYKAGQKPGHPRFRSKVRYNSFTFGNNCLTVRDRSIKIPNLGDVRAKGRRSKLWKPRTCTVKRVGLRWIATVICDVGPAPEKCAVSNPVGVDLGLKKFVTLSDGGSIDNPRLGRKHEARIAAANQQLARKQKRSKNRLRAKEVLRRAHQRAADARRNFTHHVSKWLLDNYDLIAFENLNVQGMAKSRLAKSIHEVAWAELIGQITYKAESAGKWAVPVNPMGTSIRCSSCGTNVPKTLKDRQHNCACGVSLDRDHNAALNVLALGRSAAKKTKGLKVNSLLKDADCLFAL